jgi:2'-5' RNA ligase
MSIPYKIRGLGVFPNMKKPSVIWCGVHPSSDDLYIFQKSIETILFKLGFPKENRSFKPHLTLARVRRNKKIPEALIRYIKQNDNLLFGESTFDKCVLFKSHLTAEGPIYSALNTFYFEQRK